MLISDIFVLLSVLRSSIELFIEWRIRWLSCACHKRSVLPGFISISAFTLRVEDPLFEVYIAS